MLPLETLLYSSSYFSLIPCLKGSHVSLPHVNDFMQADNLDYASTDLLALVNNNMLTQ